MVLLSSCGFLTDKRGTGTLNSKERDEVTGSGCHLGLLGHWRHCWPLGASLEKVAPGVSEEGQGRHKRKAREGMSQEWPVSGLAGAGWG